MLSTPYDSTAGILAALNERAVNQILPMELFSKSVTELAEPDVLDQWSQCRFRLVVEVRHPGGKIPRRELLRETPEAYE